MSDPTTPTTPDGAPSWLATLGLVAPYAIALLVAVIVGVRKVLGSGTDTIVEWLASMRRVADTRRDGVLDAMQEQIDGLKTIVEQLQAEMSEVRGELDEERRDRAHSDRYGWAAYGEIVRLDPKTTFPMPQPRRVVQPHPSSLADTQPPGD